jgi:16S rRNA (cytosine1402-N4)-methyltransferase
MLAEVLTALDPQPGRIMVDATLGGGGHARALAERLRPGGRLIGIDQDPDAVAEAGRTLADLADVVTVIPARFDAIGDVLNGLGIDRIDGVLFDLGVSSYQLDTPARGFSFKDPGAVLDARMNPAGGGRTAADLLNTLGERELATLIRENSDEKWAGRIAQYIVRRRAETPYRTVGQLVDTVHAAMPVGARPDDKHAATRTFQALRIAVNDELTVLGHALESAVDRLAKGGTITALSYHSIEDRIVKRLLAEKSGRGAGEGPYGTRPPALLELVSRKPLEPSAAEVAANPRARSAKLRAAKRL